MAYDVNKKIAQGAKAAFVGFLKQTPYATTFSKKLRIYPTWRLHYGSTVLYYIIAKKRPFWTPSWIFDP